MSNNKGAGTRPIQRVHLTQLEVKYLVQFYEVYVKKIAHEFGDTVADDLLKIRKTRFEKYTGKTLPKDFHDTIDKILTENFRTD